MAAGAALLILLLYMCFHQGLNWDEPWILDQARLLASRQPTEPFKPLAGLLALPFVHMDEPWVAMRFEALAWQAALGWIAWRMLPAELGRGWRWLTLALLWLEPTFREYALELRTEIPTLVAVGIAILIWRGAWPRLPKVFAAVPLAGALGIAPKSVLWIASWLLVVIVTEGRSRETWKRLAAIFTLASVLFLCLWAAAAFWTHRHLADLLLASNRQNQQALSGTGWFPPQARYYLLQTLRLGWPYYSLAILGLVAGRRRPVPAHVRDWMGAALLPWLLVPVYAGAFPYHFVGLIPPLVPWVARGFQSLTRWFGSRGFALALAASALAAVLAAVPVLSGPSLLNQCEVLRLARGYLQPGQGYVDGVGMLPTPQSAFFVTSLTADSPAAHQLTNRWEEERVSLFILDGRTEQLLREGRLAWARRYFVQVHPNLLVLGTAATGEGELVHDWQLPWKALLRLSASKDWSWSLNGSQVKDGEDLELPPGDILLKGTGPGQGQAFLFLKPPPKSAPAAIPFFLPFQRF